MPTAQPSPAPTKLPTKAPISSRRRLLEVPAPAPAPAPFRARRLQIFDDQDVTSNPNVNIHELSGNIAQVLNSIDDAAPQFGGTHYAPALVQCALQMKERIMDVCLGIGTQEGCEGNPRCVWRVPKGKALGCRFCSTTSCVGTARAAKKATRSSKAPSSGW